MGSMAWGICCRCMDCIVYLSNVKCILMQWPKGNKEYKPPLRENRSFLLIYVQRVLEASSLRVYGFLMRHSFEFIHLFLELHGTKLFQLYPLLMTLLAFLEICCVLFCPKSVYFKNHL